MIGAGYVKRSGMMEKRFYCNRTENGAMKKAYQTLAIFRNESFLTGVLNAYGGSAAWKSRIEQALPCPGFNGLPHAVY